MPTRTPRPKPEPVPAAVLIERLQALEGRKAVRPKQIISALRAPDVDWLPEDLDRILSLLDGLDPTWTVRLAVVTRSLPSKRSDLAKRLGARLISRAREQTAYPTGESSLGPPTSWIADGMTLQPDGSRPIGLVLVALWPDRAAPWFRRVAFELLRLWSRTTKAEPAPGTIAAALALAGPSGQVRARQIVTFARDFEADARRAELVREEAVSERDRARRARESAEAALREREIELAAARNEIAALRAEIAQQAESAARRLEEKDAAARAAGTSARNEIESLRRRVRDVLTRETEEIHLYLDRPTPNVEGARARLANLRELNSQITAPVEGR